MLRHFRILSVMESAAEPWFEDARVKTCVAILQRCDDERTRMENIVRFVRFSRKIGDILGVASAPDTEKDRQSSIESLRNRILSTTKDCQDEDMRIIVRSQRELWDDGVRARAVLIRAETSSPADDDDDDLDDEPALPSGIFGSDPDAYVAGKWGRYVRAPDIYFDIMQVRKTFRRPGGGCNNSARHN